MIGGRLFEAFGADEFASDTCERDIEREIGIIQSSDASRVERPSSDQELPLGGKPYGAASSDPVSAALATYILRD